MRRTQDDLVARSVAENQIRDLTSDVNEPVGDLGQQIIGAFKTVEFETTTRRVGDEDLHLRRLVVTGPWEVDPSQH